MFESSNPTIPVTSAETLRQRVGRRTNVAHCGGVTCMLLISVLMSAILSDGGSIVKLKSDPPIAVPSLNPPATLRDMVGYPYGVGAATDTRKYEWHEGSHVFNVPGLLQLDPLIADLPGKLKEFKVGHPLQILECDVHIELGTTVMALALVATIVAWILIIMHVLVAFQDCCGSCEHPTGYDGTGASLSATFGFIIFIIQVILVTLLFLAVTLGGVLLHKSFACGNTLMPRLKVSSHFDVQYGIAAVCVSFACAVVAAALLINAAVRFRPALPTMSPFCGLCIVLSTIVCELNTDLIADGHGALILKGSPPVVTAGSAKFTLKDLFGNRYGIGAWHDSKYYTWEDGGEFTPFTNDFDNIIAKGGHSVRMLKCDDHENLGKAIAGLTWLCGISAALAVVLHSLSGFGLAGKWTAWLGLLLQVVLAIASVLLLGLAAALYDQEFTCAYPVSWKLRLADHFESANAIGFFAANLVLSIVNVVFATLALRSSGKPPPAMVEQYDRGLAEEEMVEEGEDGG